MATITGDAYAFYQKAIQRFMRDYAPSNILLDEPQFSPEDVYEALCNVVSEYQVIPPIAVSATITTLPRYLVLLGAARWLMLSESMLQIRNQVSFQSDDNEAVGIDDKYGAYLQLQQQMKTEWKNAAKQYKISQNMEMGYGNLNSGYLNVTRYNS